MPPTLLSRRSFTRLAAALPLALRALASPQKSPRWVFLGTDQGPGIFRCAWNAATGTLGPPELAVKTERPDFFALHPTLPRLYSVNSLAGPAATVSAFALDAVKGNLRFVNKQSSHGDGPCALAVDATGRAAFAANYTGGSFAALPLTIEGNLLPATGTLDCKQSPACGPLGPVHDRQDAAHLHCATISPNNDFVLACDLGSDSIHIFAIHPTRDNPLGRSERIATRPGSGPRHLAFHPNAPWLYVIHELDCTLQLFDWSAPSTLAEHAPITAHSGPGPYPLLTPRADSVTSTLAPNTPLPGNTACEILISPNGKFLYATTRGLDTITVYRIDQATGLLTPQQTISTGGKTPRHMAFDPTGHFLLSANQATPGSVTIFPHDPQTGHLSPPTQTLPADTPMFIQFA